MRVDMKKTTKHPDVSGPQTVTEFIITGRRQSKLASPTDALGHAILRYNLACYECQLGRLEQAKDWLHKAFAIDDAKELKLMALDDPDLEQL